MPDNVSHLRSQKAVAINKFYANKNLLELDALLSFCETMSLISSFIFFFNFKLYSIVTVLK